MITQTMDCDPRIICFRHCSTKSIFCKLVPEICPVCCLYIEDYNIVPFLIPYPYTNAAQHMNALVLRPSQGSFLECYDIVHDLHIGITNSNAIVFEYDKVGLIVNDHTKWRNCIALHIVPSSWNNHWNEILEILSKDPKWNSRNYNETSMNCFSFVIEFMSKLQYTNLDYANKESMCEKLILPKLKDVLKYNSIYQKLNTTDFFIS